MSLFMEWEDSYMHYLEFSYAAINQMIATLRADIGVCELFVNGRL